MRKYLFTVICTALCVTVLSAQEITIEEGGGICIEQETVEPEPKSSVFFDGNSYNFIFSWKKKATESHWTGFGFAFSNLDGLEIANLNQSRSYSFILNLMDYVIPLDHHWLFSTGVGFDWSRYHFKDNVVLQNIDGIAQFKPDMDGSKAYKDSKLLLYYTTIPLILEYQYKVNRHKTFFIEGGAEGLIKCYSKSQTKYQTAEGTHRQKYRQLNTIPLNFRLITRIGFDDFSLYGYYQPVSPFEKDKGPDVNPYGIGLILNF
ncbi:MAG: outer membrane beta-barrel protein [Tannerella sp.]|jgi:hypothetical protein|nr:outer membrane beta-barrel protein [Tannerella sp.]